MIIDNRKRRARSPPMILKEEYRYFYRIKH